jgi:hypothetical protein
MISNFTEKTDEELVNLSLKEKGATKVLETMTEERFNKIVEMHKLI